MYLINLLVDVYEKAKARVTYPFSLLIEAFRVLGIQGFAALIDPANYGKVFGFYVDLVKSRLPEEMTIGIRTYKVHKCVLQWEKSIGGDLLVERALEVGANSGEEDALYILAHQGDIPEFLRGHFTFFFPGSRYNERVKCLRWNVSRHMWTLLEYPLDREWYWDEPALVRT